MDEVHHLLHSLNTIIAIPPEKQATMVFSITVLSVVVVAKICWSDNYSKQTYYLLANESYEKYIIET